MANTQNTQPNNRLSGISGVRRKSSPLLQPAKEKLLEAKKGDLAAIQARLKVLDNAAAPAPAPAPVDLDQKIDLKVVEAKSVLERDFAAKAQRVLAEVTTKYGELIGRLESNREHLTERLHGLAKRVEELEGRLPPSTGAAHSNPDKTRR